MEHNCAEHFKVDFAEDPDAIDTFSENRVTIWGKCSECGRELGKRFVFTEIIDQKTGEVVKG